MSDQVLRFETVFGQGAQALANEYAITPFQNDRWVQAVAASRGRSHEFVAVRHFGLAGRDAFLFGAIHRRMGLTVFESMPMGGYGGWVDVSGRTPEAAERLTVEWLKQSPWSLLRLTGNPSDVHALPASPRWPPPIDRMVGLLELATHLLDIRGSDEERILRVKPRMRSYLRKIDTHGFQFDFGGAEKTEDFLGWYRRGSEAWSRPASALFPADFFKLLIRDKADIWTVSRDGQVLGAALFLCGRTTVQYQASGTAKVPGPMSAMDALMWQAIRHYGQQGLHTLNFGASDGLESVRQFKEKFGGVATRYPSATYLLPKLRPPQVAIPSP